MNAREFLEILHVAEKLKDTPRHCTTSKRRVESVAEHSWRASLMALLLKDEFPEVDMDRVVSMCLIHDLGECFTGDIPAFDKTDADRKTEDELLDNWVKSLPEEVSRSMSELYAEMSEQVTPEARLYKAIDKLEAVIQHNEAPIDTWSENEYELNKTYAYDVVEHSDWLKGLRDEILKDTLEKIEKEKPDIRELPDNIDKIHSTEMGIERIRKNLKLGEVDIIAWCKEKISDPDAVIERQGKNWYVRIDGCEIAVNAKSYTIITAHKRKAE